jgi:Ca2+-transporting ATPase
MQIPLIDQGLSHEQAEQQRLKFGSNALEKSTSAFWHRALKSAKEPMLLLLFACALIYLLLGDFWSGIVFLGWTSLVLLSSFYRNYRTAKVLAALEDFAQPSSVVIREGKQLQIKRQEVVVWDSVLLKEGTRIPADGYLVSGTYLKVDESMVTGEAIAVEKNQQNSPLFSGTMVIQGEGIMQVSAVGKNAAIGKISTMLKDNEAERRSPLQKSIQALITWSFVVAIGIATLITVVFAFTRGSLLEAILNGLSTAMAILPEEFPMVLTLFYSLAAWRLAQKNVLTSRSAVLEAIGSTSVLCTDKTGTLTKNKMTVGEVFPIETTAPDVLAQTARLATPIFSHDAMENALRDKFPRPDHEKNLKHLQKYPISSTCFAMAHLYKNTSSYNVFSKGAPETIMKLCNLTPSEQLKIAGKLALIAKNGQRILGFARAQYKKATAPISIEDFDFELVGFIGFTDPIRRGVPTAMKKLKQAGVRVVMVTGDYPLTAISIAKKAGFSAPYTIINGQEFATTGLQLDYKNVAQANIFARILPAQKLQLVRLLQAQGEVVAMIGDGINDAPALQAADIGIAMGLKGADVAREAASLVLLKDQFTALVEAISMGRHLINKIQNALSYIVAIHIPIIGLCILPALFSTMPVFLLPFHIAFLELIIDPACSLAFENAPKEKNVMQVPPKVIPSKLISKRELIKSMSYGLLVFFAIIGAYLFSRTQNENPEQQRLLVFGMLVLGNLLLILNTLSRTKTSWQVLKESGWITWSILILSLLGLVLVSTIPTWRSVFHFEAPSLWSILIASTCLSFTALLFRWLNRW